MVSAKPASIKVWPIWTPSKKIEWLKGSVFSATKKGKKYQNNYSYVKGVSKIYSFNRLSLITLLKNNETIIAWPELPIAVISAN